MKSFKYLTFLTVFFTVVLIISNIVSTKITKLGLLTFDAGTLLFPLSYIFGDVLTEVYGFRRSRQVIWTGFFFAFFSALIIYIVGLLPVAPGWQYQEAYQNILGLTPRIITASLIAYLFGEFSNSFILAKLKIKTAGRFLWLRTISSTLVGEGLDTLLFVLIAFTGVLPTTLLLTVILSNYIFKVGVEVIFTPLTYKVVKFLKKQEGEDYYDYQTNFNPFKIESGNSTKGGTS